MDELERMLNSGSSSEWGDDQLPDDDQVIGTQAWTETSQDQLVVIWRSNFHQTGFTEVKVHDADDRPHLVRLENLSQLTRSGERIERGDPLRRMHVRIHWIQNKFPGYQRCVTVTEP